MNLFSAELWNWGSPVWLAALAILATWLIVVQSVSRLWMVLAGLTFLVLAYVSPVGVLADGYLFSAHMLQHLVLLLVVPLCLLLALPPTAPSASPLPRWKQLVSIPLIGWVCGVGAMWFWHMPTFCAASIQYGPVGLIRDLTFLVAGFLFWWPVFSPTAACRLAPPSAIVYLFSACTGCTLLGIYITFTTVTVCPAFANPVDRVGILTMLYNGGFTPTVDQSLGGLLMWVPPCFLYISVIIGMLCRWYTGGVVAEPATVGQPATAGQADSPPS